jgi:hypothetical protein
MRLLSLLALAGLLLTACGRGAEDREREAAEAGAPMGERPIGASRVDTMTAGAQVDTTSPLDTMPGTPPRPPAP